MAEPLLNKSQIQQLISTPSLAVRWFILWLCSVVLLVSIAAGLILGTDSSSFAGLIVLTPPILLSIFIARATWRPTAKLRRFGEISSVLFFVLSLLLTLVGFAGSSQPFAWSVAVFGFLGIGGMILSAASLILVEIACAGVPRQARDKKIQLTKGDKTAS